jgi:hypothetical protein
MCRLNRSDTAVCVKAVRARSACYSRGMKTPLILLATIALSACATTGSSPQQTGANTKVIDAATAPLGDLNLVRAEIPAALLAAQKAPYALPGDKTCAALTADVQALDAVLGADLDAAPTAANPSLVERGSASAGNAAIGALRNTAEGVVPFRGWVRKLSGAERYSKDVTAAIAAGTVRRAFLKGLGQSAGCTAPAAPRS